MFKYFVKTLSEDGLLKNPTNSICFNLYGYDTKEEAVTAIEKQLGYSNFIILESYSKSYD